MEVGRINGEGTAEPGESAAETEGESRKRAAGSCLISMTTHRKPRETKFCALAERLPRQLLLLLLLGRGGRLRIEIGRDVCGGDGRRDAILRHLDFGQPENRIEDEFALILFCQLA